MIVSFSVENFRSFAGEETFSLVASNRFAGHHDNHAVTIAGAEEKVLRTAVLYGANGAGKSNLFKALEYLKDMALAPRAKNSGTGRTPFRLGEIQDQVTAFDIHFVADDRLYRFGFKVDDLRVAEEWLLFLDGNKERLIYERVTDAKGKVTIKASGGKKLKALATIGGPQNQTFLSTIRATLEPADYGKDLTAVLGWLEHILTLISPQSQFAQLGQFLAHDADFLEFASSFLKSSSTGVDKLNVARQELSEEQLRGLLPEPMVSNLLNNLREDGALVVPQSEGREILVIRTGQNRYYLFTIHAEHKHQKGETVALELADESDGTRRLLHLIPALHHLRTRGGVYVIDEIDRSMHPILTRKFLEFFLKCCDGTQRQIIVTTHESNLLDLELLRRDEIWFAEKDNGGASRLYSLADFKVRKDLEIRRHYLQGRFGAIPFLGGVDRLLDEDVCA